MNSVKEINIENRTYYFSDDMINIKNLDLNKIKTDEKPHKNIFIYYVGYMIVKNLNYVKINSLNPLYLITYKVNGYIKESNGNKYLTLASTAESKEIKKKYEELWSKIRHLIRFLNNSTDDYDQKYIKKIVFNLDVDLPSNKALKPLNMIVAVRSVFHEGNKYYPQVSLDECFYSRIR